MANLKLRSTTSATDPGSISAKGSALSHTEMDSNFILLNDGKLDNVTDDFTGTLSIKGSGGSATGAVRHYDNDDSHYIDIKSPATLAANYTLTLPTTDGDADQVLQTDGSGNLTWATVSGASGDITSVVAGAGMTGGATTGDATLNVVGGTGITANADDIELDFTAVTELTSGLASTDELVLNDAGVLKRMDISVLSAYTASLTETLTNKTIGAATLSGTLDVKNNTIESSNANVTIQANSTDKEIHLKVKDAGATLQTAAEFRDYAYQEQQPAGSGGTTTTVYGTIVDVKKGIRIGSSANEFSSTGATGNNITKAYNLSGLIVGNEGNTWPVVEVISNGEAEGENPLYNRLGAAQQFPNGQFNFKASNGTAASPAALGSGNRMGQINWYGHDGTGYGGSSDAAPSATITASANETFSGDTRGGKIVIDVLPSGQSGGTGTGSGDRIEAIDITGSEVTINSSSADLDFVVNSDTVANAIKVDAGTDTVSLETVIIKMPNLPTSDPSNAGQLWNDSGTLKVSAG